MIDAESYGQHWYAKQRLLSSGRRFLGLVIATLALTGSAVAVSATAPASASATEISCQVEYYNEQWHNCSGWSNYWKKAQGRIRTVYNSPTVCLGLYDNGAQNCGLEFIEWGLSGNLHDGVALWQYDSAPGGSVWSGGPGLWQWWHT